METPWENHTLEHDPPARYSYHCKQDEWSAHKPRIIDLYTTGKKKLPEVVKLMEQHHGFKRSVSQYKKKLSEWKICKNETYTDKQLAAVVRKVAERPEKRTSIMINGERRDPTKIVRTIQRRCAQDSFDIISQFSSCSSGGVSALTPSTNSNVREVKIPESCLEKYKEWKTRHNAASTDGTPTAQNPLEEHINNGVGDKYYTMDIPAQHPLEQKNQRSYSFFEGLTPDRVDTATFGPSDGFLSTLREAAIIVDEAFATDSPPWTVILWVLTKDPKAWFLWPTMKNLQHWEADIFCHDCSLRDPVCTFQMTFKDAGRSLRDLLHRIESHEALHIRRGDSYAPQLQRFDFESFIESESLNERLQIGLSNSSHNSLWISADSEILVPDDPHDSVIDPMILES